MIGGGSMKNQDCGLTLSLIETLSSTCWLRLFRLSSSSTSIVQLLDSSSPSMGYFIRMLIVVFCQ